MFAKHSTSVVSCIVTVMRYSITGNMLTDLPRLSTPSYPESVKIYLLALQDFDGFRTAVQKAHKLVSVVSVLDLCSCCAVRLYSIGIKCRPSVPVDLHACSTDRVRNSTGNYLACACQVTGMCTLTHSTVYIMPGA